ncbi:MAG: hypothetical protein R6V58_08990 [Planctomycetota bacterium]
MSVLGGLALLAAGALFVTGCTSAPPKTPVYTEAEPGPWAKVMPTPPRLVKVDGDVRLTIDYKRRMTDFVDRVKVLDDQGITVLNLARDFGQPLDVTFGVPPGTETLTVLVSSTAHGKWRSDPVDVSSLPAEKKPEEKQEPL